MKYNKGDKVKVIDNWGDPRSCKVGDICTVSDQVRDSLVIATNERTGGQVGMLAERFEPYKEPNDYLREAKALTDRWERNDMQHGNELHERIAPVIEQYYAEQEAKQRAEAAALRRQDPDWRPEPGEEYCRIGANGEAKINKYSDCKGQQALANLDNAYPPEQYEELQESLRQRQRMMDLTRELGRPGKDSTYGYVVSRDGNESCIPTGVLPRWMQVTRKDRYRLEEAFTAEQVRLIVKYL